MTEIEYKLVPDWIDYILLEGNSVRPDSVPKLQAVFADMAERGFHWEGTTPAPGGQGGVLVFAKTVPALS